MARARSAAQQARVALQARSEVKKGKKVIPCLKKMMTQINKVKAPASSSSSSPSPRPVSGSTNSSSILPCGPPISLLTGDVEKELKDWERSSYVKTDSIDRALREWEMICYNGVKIEAYWEAPLICDNEAVDVKVKEGSHSHTLSSSLNGVEAAAPENVLEVMKKTSSASPPSANTNTGVEAAAPENVLEVMKKTSSIASPSANTNAGVEAVQSKNVLQVGVSMDLQNPITRSESAYMDSHVDCKNVSDKRMDSHLDFLK